LALHAAFLEQDARGCQTLLALFYLRLANTPQITRLLRLGADHFSSIEGSRLIAGAVVATAV
jgi:hypothetical protein